MLSGPRVLGGADCLLLAWRHEDTGNWVYYPLNVHDLDIDEWNELKARGGLARARLAF